MNTRNLIVSTLLALVSLLGLLALAYGSKDVAMSFGVVAALAILGGIELQGATRRLPRPARTRPAEPYRSAGKVRGLGFETHK